MLTCMPSHEKKIILHQPHVQWDQIRDNYKCNF